MEKNDDAIGKYSIEVGTIICTEDSPTTTKFAFVVSNNSLRKGHFVQVARENGMLLGNVLDIVRANRYFERAESVAEYERTNSMSHFPTFEWEYVIAEVRILGEYNKELIERTAFPPAPGDKVFIADDELIKKFLGFREDGLELGNIAYHGVKPKLSLTKLFQKHLAILAMSGAGKSHLAGVLIEEILERKEEMGNVGVVIIDVHGEYVGFKATHYKERINIVEGKKIRIALRKMSPQSLSEILPNISSVAQRDLTVVLEELKNEMKEKGELYGLEELIKKAEASEAVKQNIKGTLLSWLHDLARMRIISKGDHPHLSELVKVGTVTVIDLSDLDDQRRKELIVAHISRKLFAMRKKEKIPPFVLIIEEAHNFAKEKAPKEMAIAKRVIEKIAREGRKFGASLCLISQRPVQLSTTALSQCNTHIILRVTNPYDIDHIGKSCEGIDGHMLKMITSLRVGEALIVGEAVTQPIFIKVRERKTKIPTKSVSLEEMSKRWLQMQKTKEDDVEAFI